MPELTLEALDQRLAALERKIESLTSVIPPLRDWRSVVGISEMTEFSQAMLAEMAAYREADRAAAIAEAEE